MVVGWICLAQDRNHKSLELFALLSDYSLLKNDRLPWSYLIVIQLDMGTQTSMFKFCSY
jgi:hypothetical protein